MAGIIAACLLSQFIHNKMISTNLIYSNFQGWPALQLEFPELNRIPSSWPYHTLQIILNRQQSKNSVFILCNWDQSLDLFQSFTQTLSQSLQTKLSAWSKIYWNITALNENRCEFIVTAQELTDQWPAELWTVNGDSPLRTQVHWDNQSNSEINWSSSLIENQDSQEEILYNYDSQGELLSSATVQWFEGTGLLWDLELDNWSDHEFICWQDSLGDWLALAPIRDRGHGQVEGIPITDSP